MSVFANLKEIEMIGNPVALKQETIADMISQAHNNAQGLRDRMFGLSERSGVYVPTPTTAGPAGQNAIVPNMHSLAQDLLRVIESCHEAMNTLDRIA